MRPFSINRRSTKIIVTHLFTGLLFGCERYAITLNQQPVYTPPPLYSEFSVADSALKDCLKQTIADQNITRVEQLISLTCRHTGLNSIAGLAHFSALQELDISHNQLHDVKELAKLKQLKSLKLSGNVFLSCDEIAALRHDGLTIVPPTHCLN